MIPRILSILGSVDLKTAGKKTYIGLAIAAAALVCGHFQVIPADAVEPAVVVGLAIAGMGKVLADKRAPAAPVV
jgi:hypothetical protein